MVITKALEIKVPFLGWKKTINTIVKPLDPSLRSESKNWTGEY